MNEKQQQLTFDKGITNVPSDAICSDNALAECIGMVYEDGEHRVIQNPALFATGAPKIVFVHMFNEQSRFITYESNEVKWGIVNEGAYDHKGNVMNVNGTPSVTAIGKVLIVNDDDGMHFFLWKDNAYTDYSTDMPEIFLNMWLDPSKEIDPHDNPIHIVTGQTFLEDYITESSVTNIINFNLPTDKEKHDGWQNAVIGAITEKINTLHKLGAFCFPFWVRYGIVMYDNSVTHLSAPILVMPSVLHGAYMDHTNADGENEVPSRDVPPFSVISFYFKPDVAFGFLRAQLSQDAVNTLNDWKDIVSGIRIYVSEEVKPFELEGVWDFFNVVKEENTTILRDSVCMREWSTGLLPVPASSWHSYSSKRRYDDEDQPIVNNLTTFVMPQQKTEEKIRKELIDNSVFYKLFDIDITEISTNTIVAEDKFGKNFLLNLTTQEILENDDYFSHAKTKADYMFPYNGRLNIAGIKRIPFEGAHQFMLCETISTYDFTIRVYIDVDGEEIIASHTVTNCKPMLGKYFYYPDPRAKKAEVYMKDNNVYKLLYTFTLKEHPGLNGAYYFEGFPNADDKGFDSVLGYYDNCYPQLQDVTLPSYDQKAENLSNTVQTSEVNNPFLFLAKGTFKIGVGTITAMSTVTHALSQGQFGAFPLLVFADSGVWAATLNSEGYFTKVDPLSREVCNNTDSVVQTDNSVFFSSEKGLMCISQTGVVCVSKQLTSMTQFLRNAFIAYDYRDSLLWIFNNSRYAYIYSLKSGTFSRYDFGTHVETVDNIETQVDNVVTNVVNNYPDYLLQINSTLLSLISRDIDYADTALYDAMLENRPMKLENALALKSIMQVRHICQFSPYTVTETHEDPETHENVETTETRRGTMSLHIYASNNLDTEPNSWVELHSLRGTPWKYYRFRYDFSNLIATDRFAGTMLITQERRTNKLR